LNYHISIDDKFIDGVIEDAEAVSSPNSNLYFIRGDELNPRHVTSAKAIWVADIWSEEFRNILNTITSHDRLIIHWYDLEIGKLMLTIKPEIPLYVAVWGGDFYGDPFLYQTKWLFDKDTWNYVSKAYHRKIKIARRPDYIIKQLWDLYKKKIEDNKVKLLKQQSVKRINTILLYPNNSNEIKLIKQIYKLDSINCLPFLYNQNFDLANSLRENKSKDKQTICIQIGNSAAETNNHLDSFNELKKFKDNDITLVLPLSYGSKEYSNSVKAAGHCIFKNKFTTLEDFMSRKEYIKYLSGVDICIMYHNRSQAFGNCIALLTLGKKLYLKSKNPLYQLFKSSGLVLYDATQIQALTFEEFSKPLSTVEVQSNVRLIAELFSSKKRLKYLTDVLN
jgi:dTDP-N-acetylfucosamine:lipid II N-acetylfucosaminyltransferase